jgi:hypothetical protein
MAMRWGISKPTSSPIRETLDAKLTLRGLLQREGLNRGDDLCRAVPVEVACGQSLALHHASEITGAANNASVSDLAPCSAARCWSSRAT